MLRHEVTADAIDQALAGTFPASDAPGWTPGIVRPPPAAPTEIDATPTAPEAAVPARTAGCREAGAMPRSERTNRQALASLLGAIGVVLMFPLAILALGLPLALAVRGVFEAVAWLTASVW